MKSVIRLMAAAMAANGLFLASISAAALTTAQYDSFAAAASATPGSVKVDTNGDAGYTFTGAGGTPYTYGALGSAGSTVVYLANLTKTAGGSGAALGVVSDSAGSGDRLKFEQYNNSGLIGVSRSGTSDYKITGASSPYGQDSMISFVNEADGSFELYIDATDEGNIVGTFGATFVTTGSSTATGTLGGGNAGEAATGTIYAVATYSAPLSSSQISSLYNSVPEPTSLGLAAVAAAGFLLRRRNRVAS